MQSPSKLYPEKVDLTNCDKEPIHILGKTQAYGILLVCDTLAYKILHYSENALEYLTLPKSEILGTPLAALFDGSSGNELEEHLRRKEKRPLEVSINATNVLAIIHYRDDLAYVEIEPLDVEKDTFRMQQELSEIITVLSEATSLEKMCETSAVLIKALLGYDRVMLYQFDAHWNGKVIAEAREEQLENWLGMNYPASDIPKQARALFLKQGVRIITDVNQSSVAIAPQFSAEGNPVDLSQCELRAVSPIHIEYLKNMQVGATLTAAIISNGTLWGLIACHHYSPKFLNYYKRLSVKFLTQVFATQLTLRSSNEVLERINEMASVRSKLVTQMSDDWDIHKGLLKGQYSLLDMTSALGAGVFYEGKLSLLGDCPDKNEVIDYIQNIAKIHKTKVYTTIQSSKEQAVSSEFLDKASGVCCVFLTKKNEDCLIWFKPEKRQTISWAGNPEKAVQTADGELTPRKSFERWNIEQKATSEPWGDHEISSALALRENIQEIVLMRFDEVKLLNDKLKKAYQELESFSYSVSHDLRAPLRGIDGFAQIIKEDYYDALDEYGKSAIKTIIDATNKMNELIDDILALSVIGKKEASMRMVSMDAIVQKSLDFLHVTVTHKHIEIVVQKELPEVYGDQSMLFQLLNNLIGNALKYSNNAAHPRVEIGFEKKSEAPPIFYVKDNGVGFNNKHKHKLFKVFSRLVGDEIEGTGIGLAIAKRVTDKHDGAIWAEGSLGEGATFYFQLKVAEDTNRY